MPDSLRNKSVNGVIWSAVERVSLLGMQFAIQIVLARLLTPEDYGIIGLLAVFLAVSQAFIDSGVASALVQNQSRTERDFATAFFFNIAMACFFYALLFAGAPYVAVFYQMPQLVPVTRVIGLTLIFGALSAVHRTLLGIRVDFKTQAKASLAAVIISGAVGIILAYRGAGVWALVAQALINAGVNTILLWSFVRWSPQYFFSFASFRPMFSFGSRLLGAILLHTIYANLYPFVIGKFFSVTQLGFYSRADQMAALPASSGSEILGRVTFPLLATIQEDNKKLKDVYRKYLRLATGIIAPAMLGICALSKPLVLGLLGDKWLPAVPLMQILCLGWMLDPIARINLNLLYVKGRSDLVFRLEIVKKITATAILVASIPFGIIGLCCGRAIYAQVAIIMNAYYTGKFIKMGYWAQVREVLPIYLLSGATGVIASCLTMSFDSILVQLIAGTLCGGAFYLFGACMLKFEVWQEIVFFTKKFFGLLKTTFV